MFLKKQRSAVCVCVCVCERERERECVSVNVAYFVDLFLFFSSDD